MENSIQVTFKQKC